MLPKIVLFDFFFMCKSILFFSFCVYTLTMFWFQIVVFMGALVVFVSHAISHEVTFSFPTQDQAKNSLDKADPESCFMDCVFSHVFHTRCICTRVSFVNLLHLFLVFFWCVCVCVEMIAAV